MYFREFLNKEEQNKAVQLIGTIDKGELWIYNGAEGSEDLGGIIDQFYFCDGDNYGTFSSCIFGGKLRIHIGFKEDLPQYLEEELLDLIIKSREKVNTFTSIWYVPTNENLDQFLFHQLPWEVRGHKTYEFTAKKEDFIHKNNVIPAEITVRPYETADARELSIMLDKSMAHTFDDPTQSIFHKNLEHFSREWEEKGNTGECQVMIKDGTLVGAYILKESEIDIIAIANTTQKKGLGSVLLNHAISFIGEHYKENPYLYCIERNTGANEFYHKKGLTVTGFSGYAYMVE